MAASRIRELSRARCLELLATTALGRVGLSVRALPAVFPVNYRLSEEMVIFRTVPGTKLDAAVHRSVVAFEADAHHPDGAWGWSVLIQGVASEITAPVDLARARKLLTRTWAYPEEEAVRFISVEPSFISGRAFGTIPAG